MYNNKRQYLIKV